MPKQAVTLPMGLPRDAVSRHSTHFKRPFGLCLGAEYDNVWRALLQDKRLPYTPAPDLDQMRRGLEENKDE